MKIHAVRAFEDNYIWIMVKNTSAIVVDAGEAEPVIDFLTKNQLNLTAILITHEHKDHIGGVDKLRKIYPQAQIFAHALHGVSGAITVAEGDTLTLLDNEFKVWQTAGHTDSHLSYLCQIEGIWRVFCGDTLFSGGCGRVFTGTVEALFASFERFNELPKETLFYPAHEYTLSNLQFALMLADDEFKTTLNAKIHKLQDELGAGGMSLPTSLAQERQINPFLHTRRQAFLEHLADLYPQYRQQLHEPLSVFAFLRALKNQF